MTKKRNVLIDVINHGLTGPAILRACGIHDNGELEPEDMSRGYPCPHIIMVLRGQAESKLNLIKVAATNVAKENGVQRNFTISAGQVIDSTHTYGNIEVPVTLIPIEFKPKNRKARIGAIIARYAGVTI